MVNNTESDVSEVPRNVRDLDANSKILDYQNKVIASPSIGPYPISSTVDPTVTMKSVAQATEIIDKKIKQKQYVKELEEQIRIRDRIKREEEMRNRRLKSYEPESENFLPIAKPEVEREIPVTYAPSETNSVSGKSSAVPKERSGLGSAPKAVGSAIAGQVQEGDPFGGNIPTRKKIENRIDQELESRGSIFSGRDEKSILIRKRNIQQQHMREELLRQIEEKKRREDDEKKRRMKEELEEEQRIKQEMVDLESNKDNQVSNNDNQRRRAHPNAQQRNNSMSDSNFLPELTNRQSEPLKESSPVNKPAELVKNVQSANNNFETTAAFASYKEQSEPENDQNYPSESISELGKTPFNNVLASENNKIKDMINQCDNKKSLQEQITK